MIELIDVIRRESRLVTDVVRRVSRLITDVVRRESRLIIVPQEIKQI
jgi:hypothetical protein